MTCGNNTMVIGRPTASSMQSVSCSSSCSGSSFGVGATSCNGVGPRKKREKVREEVREYILNMLGAPNNVIELDEQNIDFCINWALKIFEDFAPREYFSYYTFIATPGKSVYELPADVGYIRTVEYHKVGQFAFTASDLGGTIPLEYFYGVGGQTGDYGGTGFVNPVQPVWGKVGEWLLYKEYEQMYSRTSSNLGGWEYIGGYRHIKIYPTPYRQTRVAVHYLQRCKDWEEVSQAMCEGALTYAKEILGRIRGRIKNIPGAGGGIQLDGDQLLAEAKEERKQWMQDLIYKFGDAQLPIIMG